jgi:hypothetical protein
MKHIKTQKQLNEASENLNISDVMSSFNDEKLVKFIKEIYMQGFYDAKWGMNEDEVESKSDKFNIKWVKKNCS